MAKRELMAIALRMRKTGLSYSQIRSQIKVSKSTLSRWLRNMPLTKARITKLRDKSEKRIERYRQTMKRKRNFKMMKIIDIQKNILLPMTNRDILIAGLFWYWGEGGKTNRSSIVIVNTDPAAVKFGLYWILCLLKVSKKKIRVRLHLYKDMNIKREMEYWSKLLNISKNQFQKTQIKKTNFKDISNRSYGHGTCELIVYNTNLKERVLAGLEVMRRNFLEFEV